MFKGANSTVMVREGTISALNLLCDKFSLSKVDLISYLISYIVTLDDKDIEDILSEGKIINIINELKTIEPSNEVLGRILLDVKRKIAEANP